MTLIYFKGWANVPSYEKQCRDSGFDLNEKKVVFLFPGNSSHHGPHVTLFSIKGGSQLATAALQIGSKGYPTLSLPTTSMGEWATDAKQQATVQKAIEDLYQAFGAGYSFMLPSRDHQDTEYFDHGLGVDELLEPAFWGGELKVANKPLANHYINALNKLSEFMALSLDERLKQADDNPLHRAWLKGHLMDKNDKWLKPVVAAAHKPAEQPKKPKVYEAPASYDRIFNSKQDPLQGARELLNDYTKGDSCLSRFFHGHWNRHHTYQINRIVKKIDNATLKTIEELLEELKFVSLMNPNGSLAKRIGHIKHRTASDVNDKPSLGIPLT